jgi:uncharacterized Zn-binding protein involved in type VI secretion
MGKPIAVVGHHHSCPKVEPGPVPHVGGPVQSGAATVRVNGKPVACVGDKLVCAVGGPDTIAGGSSIVCINGKAVARLGDSTAHGGTIVAGDTAVRVS